MLQLSQQKILLPYHLTDTSEPTNSSSMIHNKKTASFQLCVWTPPKIDMLQASSSNPLWSSEVPAQSNTFLLRFDKKVVPKILLRRCPKGLETIPSLEHLPFSEIRLASRAKHHRSTMVFGANTNRFAALDVVRLMGFLPPASVVPFFVDFHYVFSSYL